MGKTFYRLEADAVRQLRVRQLFQVRYPDKPTGGKPESIKILMFYGWLDRHYPELLPRERGDPYQHLKVDLKGLYVEA